MKMRIVTFSIAVVWLFTNGTVQLSAADAKPAGDSKAKITYDEHIQPIFREHCFSCHNQEKSKGGLALDSYSKTMEGGSSGEVVFEEELDSSRLWALVTHEEEPNMPPEQDKLPADKLGTIRKWIEGGALENSGSKALVKKKSMVTVVTPTTTGKPKEAAMPAGLWRQPVVYSKKAAAVTAIASSPWAPLVAIAGQKQVLLYHSDTTKLLGVLPFPEGIPYVLRFSRDGSLLLVAGGRGGHSGYAALYDVRTGQRLVRVGDELDAVLAADINDDHSRIALGGPQRLIRIYSTQTGELVHEIKKHTDWIYSIQFSPDGVLLATGGRSGGLFVWEAETGRQYLDLRGHKGAICDVSWRSDSNVLASGSMDATIKLWEMNDGKAIKSWKAHSGGVMCVNYAQNGNIASAGRDRTAKAWDGNGKLLKTYPAFSEYALKATFSYDAKKFVAGDWTGMIRMWNVADAKQIALLPANPPTLDMRLVSDKANVAAAAALANKSLTAYQAAQKAASGQQAALKTTNDKLKATTIAAKKSEADKVATTKRIQTLLAVIKTTGTKAKTATAASLKAEAEKATVAKQVQVALAATKKTADMLAAAQKARMKTIAEKAQAEKILKDKTAAVKAAEKTEPEKTADQIALLGKTKAELATAVQIAAKKSQAAAKTHAVVTAAIKASKDAQAQHVATTALLATKTQVAAKAQTALTASKKSVQVAQADKISADKMLATQTAVAKKTAAELASQTAQSKKLAANYAVAVKQLAEKKTASDVSAQQAKAAQAELKQTEVEKASFSKEGPRLANVVKQIQLQIVSAQKVVAQAEASQEVANSAASVKLASVKGLAAKLAALQSEYKKALEAQKTADALVANRSVTLQKEKSSLQLSIDAVERAENSQQSFAKVYLKK